MRPEVVDEVTPHCRSRRIVPEVHLLERIFSEVVELAIGAIRGRSSEVGRADPVVARDGAEVDLNTEEVGVPLGQHAFKSSSSRVVI